MTYSAPESVEDKYLSNPELAARYEVSVETVRKWRATGYGPPAHKLGRHVRYRLSDVLRWEREHAD
jgi:predicted DNA-binding transcriptional regulator AlpA